MAPNLQKALIIAGEPPVILHPRKRTLHYPSALYGYEIRCAEIWLHTVKVNTINVPNDIFKWLITKIGFNCWDIPVIFQYLTYKRNSAFRIMDIGRADIYFEHVSVRFNRDMAFYSFDSLISVNTLLRVRKSRTNTLTVYDTLKRFRKLTQRCSLALHKHSEESAEPSPLWQGSEMMIYCLPIWIILWQHWPLTSRFQHIGYGVDYRLRGMLPLSWQCVIKVSLKQYGLSRCQIRGVADRWILDIFQFLLFRISLSNSVPEIRYHIQYVKIRIL